MSDAFIGEVRLLPYTFAPRFWADCDGQIISISQNTALFSIIGSTYGGDGRSTMAVPNLTTRAAMQWGTGPGLSNHPFGSGSGQPSVILSESQLPQHSHTLSGVTKAGTSATPASNLFIGKDKNDRGGQSIKFVRVSKKVTNLDAPMNPLSLANSGSSESHSNMQPYIGMRFCICLDGTYPSRN